MKHLLFLFSCALFIFSCANPSLEEEAMGEITQLQPNNQSASMEPTSAIDEHLRFKLPQGSYQNLVYLMELNAIIGEHADLTTWWYATPPINGYVHDLNVIQGPTPEEWRQLQTPRWILVHVRSKGAPWGEKLFSYSLLPSDDILFDSPADTVHADMIRDAINEILKE